MRVSMSGMGDEYDTLCWGLDRCSSFTLVIQLSIACVVVNAASVNIAVMVGIVH